MLDTNQSSNFETAIGDFSGYFMNKTMIDNYVCGLNSELFLHTDKNHSCCIFCWILMNTEKHLHFDFASVHVCSQFILT